MDKSLADTSSPPAPTVLEGQVAARLRQQAREAVVNIAFGVAGLAVVLALWTLVSAQLGPLRLPDPWTVATATVQNWVSIPQLQYVIMQRGGLGDSLAYTTISVLMTVSIGTIIGVVVGLLMVYVALFRVLLTPVLIVLGTTPVLILLPFLVQWFGNGRLVFSGLVIVFTSVVIATMTQKSIGNAAGRFRDYARSMGATRAFEMLHVALPALLPDLVSGVRISLAAAWSLQTVAELMGGKHGAGRIIGVMANLSNTTLVIAMVLCVAVTAVVIDAVFMLLAKRIQRWQS